MTLSPAIDSQPAQGQARIAGWGWNSASVVVVSALCWLLAWYGETAYSMLATWVSSETFAHGFLIVPISAWLVWRRRHVIRSLEPRPNLWLLVPLAAIGFIWLLGNLAAVLVVQQYSLVLMMLFLFAATLGGAIVKELAFPLLFLLFAVPFGEALLPVLMEHTADFTVLALKLTGIPVYREGLYFTVPSGNWSVVEACSGLRYLIASLTLGVLYAYLTYRSFARRAIFVALSILVPIVANWLRAYMIVMIGHLSGMKYAVGVDHLIYGWLFFGFVMFILFWIGSFWREDGESSQLHGKLLATAPISVASWIALLGATLLTALIVAVPPSVVSYLQRGSHDQPNLMIPPDLAGWQFSSKSNTDWTPRFLNPSARIHASYENGSRGVELYIGYYRNQRQSAELIASQNVLVHSADKAWGSVAESYRRLKLGGKDVSIVETKIRSHSTRLLVWHWYWIDGRHTANPYLAKLFEAFSQLRGRGDDSAVIVMFAPFDVDASQAVGSLQDFANNMLPSILDVLNKAQGNNR